MTERVLYEHRQIGWTIIVATAIVLISLRVSAAAVPPGGRDTLLLPLVVVILVLIAFSTLTVRVTDSYVAWWFGISGIGRRVALSEIESVSAVKTTILEGWGIHLTWHGWLWNVSGFNAVQITLCSGTRYAVGTPEPQAVIAAIERQSGGRISE